MRTKDPYIKKILLITYQLNVKSNRIDLKKENKKVNFIVSITILLTKCKIKQFRTILSKKKKRFRTKKKILIKTIKLLKM